MKRRARVANDAQTEQMTGGLRRWFASRWGAPQLQAEQEQLAEVLPQLFGYFLVQLGDIAPHSLLETTPIRHTVVADPTSGGGTNLVCDLQALPLVADGVDVVLLPHTLELVPQPHQLLREVERVLIPEGYVVISGFKPLGVWGVLRWLRWGRVSGPWGQRYLSARRLKDWLALLGFDTVQLRGCMMRVPYSDAETPVKQRSLERWLQRWWPGFGSSYVLVAQKRVIAMTPIRPRWLSAGAPENGLVEPTLRSEN